MSHGIQHGERCTVVRKTNDEVPWEDATFAGDCEELEVFDHVTVSQQHYVNSVNGHETFTGRIAGGDDYALPEPEAVTKRVAEVLVAEFGINDLESRGIQVVDMSAENVREL